MTHSNRRHDRLSAFMLRSSAVALLMGSLGMAHASSGGGASMPAPASHWVERQLDYTYFGFTDKFSCDGLRDSVRALLLGMGARKSDLKVVSRGCVRLEGPEHFPGVSAHFSVLVPDAADSAPPTAASAQPTQWQTVDLVRLSESGADPAPCELLEQMKAKALPLFTTRNLKFRSACVPHEVNRGEIRFTVDVLKTVRTSSTSPAA